jgi:hypothetical protein
MNNQFPNKLTSREIKHILKKHQEGKLNITKEAKRLGVARRSIYFHIWKQNPKKKKTLWQRIKAYFEVSPYRERKK